jgi:hypothetical protein
MVSERSAPEKHKTEPMTRRFLTLIEGNCNGDH